MAATVLRAAVKTERKFEPSAVQNACLGISTDHETRCNTDGNERSWMLYVIGVRGRNLSLLQRCGENAPYWENVVSLLGYVKVYITSKALSENLMIGCSSVVKL
jgi:hypothetical protein